MNGSGGLYEPVRSREGGAGPGAGAGAGGEPSRRWRRSGPGKTCDPGVHQPRPPVATNVVKSSDFAVFSPDQRHQVIGDGKLCSGSR